MTKKDSFKRLTDIVGDYRKNRNISKEEQELLEEDVRAAKEESKELIAQLKVLHDLMEIHTRKYGDLINKAGDLQKKNGCVDKEVMDLVIESRQELRKIAPIFSFITTWEEEVRNTLEHVHGINELLYKAQIKKKSKKEEN